MRLAPANLERLPPDVERFGYDRARQKVGIVHFGIGAFHRAHQAWYTDAAMEAGEEDWMISGVSLRSDTVLRQLAPQLGLYSITERSGSEARTRIVGSVREVLLATEGAKAIVARLASADSRVASLTVTEKGYCMAPAGGLDNALARRSFYPVLAAGLAARMNSGLPGLTVLSCDNLSGNGTVLKRLILEWSAFENPDLARWVEEHCRFPSSMVDRIVPATTPDDLDLIEAKLGLRDEGAVLTERFSQWVIEDRFAGSRPAWEKHGAQFVADVAPYETAKLRMLNGAHSLLAFCGLDRGYVFVHEAIADPGLRTLVDRLMREEAATSFTPAQGQDLAAYADALIRRFADPALQHRLMQIAMDGSQKIPPRWLATLAAHQRMGKRCPVILQGLAKWLRHVRGDLRAVDDPLASKLAALWSSAGASGIGPALFGENGLFAAHWRADEEDLHAIEEALGEV
ncbi:MAG TPA: mannitol dehydrogenase family protein [Sphingomonadaceae bacterium]|nr:mannitol dehydrogenase family protein [Sphingomonadaceae bacterium]